MKTRFNKLTAWLLTLAMLMTLVPGMTFTVLAAEVTCTCGTDDAAIHATTCAVYMAPENPVCYCAEKCTEVNEWCDICGFDYTACTGKDTAALYADGTIDLSQYSDGASVDISEDCKIIGDGNEYNISLNIVADATVTFDVGTSGVKLNAPITVADGKTLTLLIAGDAEHTMNGGISLGNGSNVIIEGDLTKENNKLTVTGTDGNAGIGANGGVTAGDITIRNARVDATGSFKEVPKTPELYDDTSISGAAIGTSDGSMGDILIENSIIVAEGGYYENTSHAPAIGIGYVGSTMGNITLKDSQITAKNNGDGLASVIGAGSNHYVNATGSLGDIVITNTDLNLSMAVSTKNWYAAVIGSGIGYSNAYVNMGKIIFTDVTQAELDEMIPTWLPSDFNDSAAYALGRGHDGSGYQNDAFGGIYVSDGKGGTVQIGNENGYYNSCRQNSAWVGFDHDFDEICGGTCIYCDVSYIVAHTLGTAATCKAPATCSVCKSEYGEVDEDAHSWGDWVTSNGRHIRTCTLDTTHTENGDCSGGTATCTEKAVCTVCGGSYGELGDDHIFDADGRCACGFQVYNLWIGGERVTSVNKDGITGEGMSGTAIYDPANNILTLDNFTYEGNGDKNSSYEYSAVYYNGSGSLKLKLEGNSSITHQSVDAHYSYGIRSNSSIEVYGTGSLTVTAGNTTNYNNANSIGVWADGGIEVFDTSSLIAKGGTAAGPISAGVFAWGSITVSEGASLTAEGGTAQYSYGVNAATMGKSVTVSGSLIAKSGTATGKDDSESYGVLTESITVYDGGSLTAIGNTADGESSSSYGVCYYGGGTITLNGGTTIAQGVNGAFDKAPNIGGTFDPAVWYGESEEAANTAGAQNISELAANYNKNYVRIADESAASDTIVNYDKAAKSATVTVKEAGTYTLIFAKYGEGNTLDIADIVEFDFKEGENTITQEIKDFALDTGDKIMLWQNMTNLVPLCEAYIVK